jgi:hypothetical protein
LDRKLFGFHCNFCEFLPKQTPSNFERQYDGSILEAVGSMKRADKQLDISWRLTPPYKFAFPEYWYASLEETILASG